MQFPVRKSSISQAITYEEMGEFWDSHDFTDFDDPQLPDIEFEFRLSLQSKKTERPQPQS